MTKNSAPDTGTTSSDVSPQARDRNIRKWIDGKLKKLAGSGLIGGLGSTLFALPALAQASDNQLSSFQFAEAIPGVRSAKLLENGDVQLKMIDGRTLVVAAENVQILENGTVMVADATAGEIAQLAATAEAAATGAASGGIGGIGTIVGGLGLAGAAAAGGGGGGGSDDDDVAPAAPPLPSLNLAQLQGTDLNNVNANLTTPEGTTSVEVTIGSLTKTVIPDADGNWSVSLTAPEASALPQGVSTITVTNLDVASAQISVESVDYIVDTIPPVITITSFSAGDVLNAAEQGTDLAISGTTDAENSQTVTITVDGQTLTGTVSGGNWTVSVPASDLAALSDASTISVTADVSDRAGNPALQASDSFDTDFTAPTVALDAVAGGSIDLIDVAADLIITGTSSAEDNQTVTVTFNGQDYLGTVSGGLWSATVPLADLAGLSTGTPVSVSVSTTDAAGNPAMPVSTSVPVDLTGPSIAISPLSVGDTINAVETGSDLTITGTTGNVTDGQQVSVILDGQTYQGTVTGGGWSVTVPSSDLGALADGGSFTISADVSDSDGLAAPQASVNLSKDATAPALSIDSFSGGAILNAAEQNIDLVVSGTTTAEDGQQVTVTLNSQTYLGTVTGGTWTATVPSADLGALSDGATVSVTADVSDQAGNPAIQATNSFDTDFTDPADHHIAVRWRGHERRRTRHRPDYYRHVRRTEWNGCLCSDH